MNSFVKEGNKSYCLVNYQSKTIECLYSTITQCRDQYSAHLESICFPKKDLKLKGGN